MPEKLKSALKNLKALPFRLALKAAIFSLFLFFAGNNIWLTILFVLVAIFLYTRPGHNSLKHGASFAILTASSLAVTQKFLFFASIKPDDSAYYGIFVVSVFFFGFLFCLLLGIKNYAFIKRKESYYLLSSLLFLSVFGLFFSADRSGLFALKQVFAGIAAYFLFKESFDILTEEESVLSIKISKTISSIIFSLIIFQAMWAICLLPIGFINSSALALLLVLILEDLMINHWSGTLSRRVILRDASFLLFLTAVIFASSKWIL